MWCLVESCLTDHTLQEETAVLELEPQGWLAERIEQLRDAQSSRSVADAGLGVAFGAGLALAQAAKRRGCH